MNTTSPTQENKSLLDNMDFEDKTYLLSIYENTMTNSTENFISNMAQFNSFLISEKVSSKLSTYNVPPSSNSHISSSIKILKMFTLLSIYKQKYFHVESSEINFTTDINLLSHIFYKIINSIEDDLISKDGTVELDLITNLIFDKLLFSSNTTTTGTDKNNEKDKVEKITFVKFKNMFEKNGESVKDKKNKINNSLDSNFQNMTNNFKNYSYDVFQKYFKILIKFYIFKDNFSHIFNIIEKKGKIMTAELVICLNKLNRGLNENTILYNVTKKFLDMINTKEIYLTKEDYYKLFLNSLQN